jgi:hypothetical protein
MTRVSNPGFLTVRMNVPTGRRWGGGVPVEVRDAKTFALKARGISGGELGVPEGKYWVGAILPNGQQVASEDLVHVREGERKEVELKWGDLELPPSLEQGGRIKQAVSDFVAPVTQFFTALSAARVSGNWLAAQLQVGPKPEHEKISNLTLDIRFSELPVLLEISSGRNNPSYFAVPVDGEKGRTTVAWKADSASGKANVEFDFHDEDLNTFFAYVQQGFADEARSISYALIGQAETYAEQQKSSLRAVLATYVLLRANEAEALDGWSDRLCSRFPWLPDGLAVRIEYLARQGRHEEACKLMPKLTERGAPWFRSGVSYIAARAKLYCSVLGTSRAKFDVAPEIRGLLDRIAEQFDGLSASLDVTQMTSVYRDLPRLR